MPAHDHSVSIHVTARTKDLARDAAFRTKERLADWLARAVAEQHFRDRVAELHRRAHEMDPDRSE
jgi:hypothetical protein